MADYRLTQSAKENLVDIWLYSEEMWGEDKAAGYLHKIDDSFHALAANPQLGRPRPELFANCRSYVVGKHVIFYSTSSTCIHILGVLHGRMDAAAFFHAP